MSRPRSNTGSIGGRDENDSDERYDNPIAHQQRHDESFVTSDHHNSRSARSRSDSRLESDDSELESDSEESDDSEDRALERELWDEEQDVGSMTEKRNKRSSSSVNKAKDRVMQSLSKGDRQQRYSAVSGGQTGSSASSRRDRHRASGRGRGGGKDDSGEEINNSLGAWTESVRDKFRFPRSGGTAGNTRDFANPATSSSEKRPSPKSHLRQLSLTGSNPDPSYFNQGGRGAAGGPSGPGGFPVLTKPRRRACHWAWIVCGVLFAIVIIAVVAVVIAAAVKGDGDVEAGFRNMTDQAAMAAGLPVTGTDSEGRTLYSLPFRGEEDGKETPVSTAPTDPEASASIASGATASATESSQGGVEASMGSEGSLSARPTSSGTVPSPTSVPETTNWNTWRGHTLGGSSGDVSGEPVSSAPPGPSSSSLAQWQQPNSNSATSLDQWSSPQASIASQPLQPQLSNAGAGVMTTLTWGNEIRTIAAGGPPDAWQSLSMSGGAVSASGTPTSTSQPGAWTPQPTILPAPAAITLLNYSTTNFSMAKAPESFQTYHGSASLFHSNGQLGPCGISGNDTDYLVALPSSLYMSSLRAGSNVESTFCGAQVLVTSAKDGKTVTATVSGSCTQCTEEQSLALSLAMYETLEFDTRTKDAPVILWGFVRDNVLADSGVTTAVTAAPAQATGKSKNHGQADEDHDDNGDEETDSWLPW